MTYFASLRVAANDATLRGAPLSVFVWLATNYLDTQECRPVKVSALAITLRMKRDTVTRALRLLVTRGYLERKYVARTGYTYRVYLVPRTSLPDERPAA